MVPKWRYRLLFLAQILSVVAISSFFILDLDKWIAHHFLSETAATWSIWLVLLLFLFSMFVALYFFVVAMRAWTTLLAWARAATSTLVAAISVLVVYAMYGHGIVETPLPYRDAIINDLNNIAAQAYQYRIRPLSMGGGEGSYGGFKIPAKMQTNENAIYEAEPITSDSVKLHAISAVNKSNTITVFIDSKGRLHNWKYTGDFQ